MALLTVRAVEVGTGALISEFAFVVNLDNVGDPFSPDPADWPSVRQGASYSPMVATGDSSGPAVAVPEGSYIVSVRAPGHKLGGSWVTVNADTAVAVALHRHPLPLARIRVRAFHDNHPVNGEDDIPLETGLPGFRVVIGDTVGEVTVDYFGNPLGTQYQRDAAGNPVLDPESQPIPVAGTGGVVLTDADGNAVVENLAPGKYELQVIPPDGTDWIQTSTIEGTHVIDAWVEEGSEGYLFEEGFRAPLASFGFVRPMAFPEPGPEEPVGIITGTVRTILDVPPPNLPSLSEPVERPWLALTDIGATDTQVFTGRGNPDGTFTIANVPGGLYQLAIWDEPLDHIISFRTVQVGPGQQVDMGDIGVPRWFGQISGTVFVDLNENGVRDPEEPGIPLVELDTRFKDGTIQYTAVTDANGHYVFPEVFELEHFAVAELGFTRFWPTGALSIPGATLPVPGPPVTHPSGTLLLAEMTWAGSRNRIDWGMKPYPLHGPDGSPGGGDDIANGGISGIVFYAVMRNETDPRFAVAEDYEPGIPGVTVNLYRPLPDGSLELLSTVETDAWTHPVDCPLPGGDTDPACTEAPRTDNQIRPGVFDGGYAFTGLEPGTYVVEVVPPPGYRVLIEGTENTGEGDEFRIAVPPPPYLGTDRDRKVVTLGHGQNAAADFYLFTDVPAPGRIVGLLVDDLNLETDPEKLYFGDKRGLPNSPVGIRDFTGALIRTVHTDPNGVFEVLLPSAYTANVPIPSGVAPGMYRLIGNDPGDPDRPNADYNPNYQSLPLVFDVWPGKTTYADIAVFPITAFVERGGVRFAEPPVLQLPPDHPQVYLVEPVFVTPTGSRTVTVSGTGFGPAPGQVTLSGTSFPPGAWSDAAIQFTVPAGFDPGPHQLLVTAANGKVSPTGLTLHVFGPDYNPRVITAAVATTLQAAIDSAADGDLIVVEPGTYLENVILYKNVKLQGKGPRFTVLDGRFFRDNAAAWRERLAGIPFDGPSVVSEGQVLTVVSTAGRLGRSGKFGPQVDGFTVTGSRGTTGGGIVVHAYGRDLEISNNVIQSNGGGFGGAITLGRPLAGDLHNDNIRLHHNRILNNGGVSLAGGIGIFNGADNYEIAFNDIGGNYSGEYGGGISHHGFSPGGRIHHNRILFNAAFDEGGGINIAGEAPAPPGDLSAGSGAVEIYSNLVQGNLTNDDGGGIRLLRAGTEPIRIYNNLIVNNVATDIGGGIAMDDASDVAIFNNTIAKNATTATAEDSDGLPHAAGIASEGHSAPFQDVLPPGSPDFSDPVLFNNLCWDNRAYHYDPALGRLADDFAVIDLEVFGTPGPRFMTPHFCYLSVAYGGGTGNIVFDGTNPPQFVQEYDTVLRALAFRGEPDFKNVTIVVDAPDFPGDYHLDAGSPAIDRGTATLTVGGETFAAPTDDIDGDLRPAGAAVDIGADESAAP